MKAQSHAYVIYFHMKASFSFLFHELNDILLSFMIIKYYFDFITLIIIVEYCYQVINMNFTCVVHDVGSIF